MRKRYRIILITLSLGIILLLGFVLDFHSYKKDSKESKVEEGQLILSITTYDGKTETKPFLKVLGHSWISIENTLNHSVMLMDYELKPEEILTCSIWAISNHFGVVFNLEPEFIEVNGRYNGRKTISTGIAESKIMDIESYIQKNDYWKFTKNCSYWSIHLWNSVVEEEYKLPTQTILYTPTRLEKAFLEYKNVEENKDFSKASGMFFYVDGKKTEVSLCK